MKGKIVNALLMTILVILVAGSAFAQTPANTILYQGKLTDDAGAPITTEVSVIITIWNTLSGGSVLYTSPTLNITPDENGLFTQEIGPLTTSILNGDKRYINLNVEGENLVPRQLMTSSPAAHTALTSVNQAGYAEDSPTDGNTLVLLTSSGDAYAACVLEAPTDGYALVTGNAIAFFYHTTGSWENVIFKVSSSENDVSTSANNTLIRMPSSLPTAVQYYTYPVSLSVILPVSAGANTFYFNAVETTGATAADDYLLAPRINAIFIPGNYDGSKALELPPTLEPEIDPYLGHKIEKEVTNKKAGTN